MQTPFFVYNRHMKSKKAKKRNTIILTAVLLVFFVSGIWIQRELTQKAQGYAVLSVDGKVIERFSMTENAEYEWVSPEGDVNRIVVKDGYVQVTEANCPDLICVHSGKITRSGEVIACLPHKLLIYVEDTAP